MSTNASDQQSPPVLRAGVIELARSSAEQNGAKPPADATFVSTNRYAALRVAGETPGPADTDQAVVVVELHGDFTPQDAHGPLGAEPPHGTVIDLVIDPKTVVTTDFYLGDKPLDLGQLGDVSTVDLT